jgi:hypothetical protein
MQDKTENPRGVTFDLGETRGGHVMLAVNHLAAHVMYSCTYFVHAAGSASSGNCNLSKP